MQNTTIEIRSLTAQLRAKQESRTISGYAAKFDTWSEPIWDWFIETIERGAFDDADMSDVIMCFNHNVDNIMARTSSTTLTLKVDQTGLYFEFEAPNTTTGNDCLEMVRRGDVSKCSFRFTIDEQKYTYKNDENGLKYDEHRIMRFGKIYDVSLVVFPAYDDTEAKNRYIEQRNAQVEKPKDSVDTGDRDRLMHLRKLRNNQ